MDGLTHDLVIKYKNDLHLLDSDEKSEKMTKYMNTVSQKIWKQSPNKEKSFMERVQMYQEQSENSLEETKSRIYKNMTSKIPVAKASRSPF